MHPTIPPGGIRPPIRPDCGASARLAADGPSTGRDDLVRACQRGRDGTDPRLLRGPLGVRAPHLPDPLEPRRRRGRELLPRLLPARPRPLPRDDDPAPASSCARRTASSGGCASSTRSSTSSSSTPATSARSCSSTAGSPSSTTCPAVPARSRSRERPRIRVERPRRRHRGGARRSSRCPIAAVAPGIRAAARPRARPTPVVTTSAEAATHR